MNWLCIKFFFFNLIVIILFQHYIGISNLLFSQNNTGWYIGRYFWLLQQIQKLCATQQNNTQWSIRSENNEYILI